MYTSNSREAGINSELPAAANMGQVQLTKWKHDTFIDRLALHLTLAESRIQKRWAKSREVPFVVVWFVFADLW